MAYIASEPDSWLSNPPQSIGDGQCVAFVQKAASAPETAKWKKGAFVKANVALRRGTAIATFDANNTYGNHTDGRSHAAIYLSQDAHGIEVMDQWKTAIKDGKGKVVGHKIQNVHVRVIRFWHPGTVPPNNDGNAYYVIE